ncbi:hypothetical protein O6H91_15G085500 [Diphasiastrum complanatum]|uniref:Uncharacterized protein n=2 Tax=Diphasiastrum complanatum TaxID=34168 RepID=A0ACC2BKB5_DIPCM|nr:hypothetical protein O6H91_15G085500 [Diphasiastrum complanatum]KAJ7530217.1 hypothetical protein O6H91_15G085500 [Diphasiastrum complanatum]
MAVFQLDTHPGRSLQLLLFTDVLNTKELLLSMQMGSLHPEVAFFNASMVPDIFPILAAAHKTLLAQSQGNMLTRTLHSELIYNYSGSKHITESLRRCGITDNTQYVLAARFDCSEEELKAVRQLLQGAEVNLQGLEKRGDKTQIQKHYKITNPELEISSLGEAITCRIATRDAS